MRNSLLMCAALAAIACPAKAGTWTQTIAFAPTTVTAPLISVASAPPTAANPNAADPAITGTKVRSNPALHEWKWTPAGGNIENDPAPASKRIGATYNVAPNLSTIVTGRGYANAVLDVGAAANLNPTDTLVLSCSRREDAYGTTYNSVGTANYFLFFDANVAQRTVNGQTGFYLLAVLEVTAKNHVSAHGEYQQFAPGQWRTLATGKADSGANSVSIIQLDYTP